MDGYSSTIRASKHGRRLFMGVLLSANRVLLGASVVLPPLTFSQERRRDWSILATFCMGRGEVHARQVDDHRMTTRWRLAHLEAWIHRYNPFGSWVLRAFDVDDGISSRCTRWKGTQILQGRILMLQSSSFFFFFFLVTPLPCPLVAVSLPLLATRASPVGFLPWCLRSHGW